MERIFLMEILGPLSHQTRPPDILQFLPPKLPRIISETKCPTVSYMYFIPHYSFVPKFKALTNFRYCINRKEVKKSQSYYIRNCSQAIGINVCTPIFFVSKYIFWQEFAVFI